MSRCPGTFGDCHSNGYYLVEILKQKGVRIKKTKAIFRCPVNKLFPIEYTYDTNQTDKAKVKMNKREEKVNR